jgi:hypothetical protein
MPRRYLLGLILFLTLAAVHAARVTGAILAPAPSMAPASSGMVISLHDEPAGDAADADPATFTFAADNSGRRLLRRDGSPINLAEVPSLYGTADGMRITVDGTDVTANSYRGFAGPKVPLGLDLSDAAGWPSIAVPQGHVAIDPGLGRFKFYPGGAPYLLGSWKPAGTLAQLSVAVAGNYAYTIDWARDLDVIDITDPAHPVWKAHVGIIGNGMDILIDGAYAYLTMKSGGLRIFDLSTPTAPVEIGSIKASPTEDDLALHLCKVGNRVYVADEKFGVVIYDVTDPRRPAKLGACPIGFGESVWVEGRYAYVTGGGTGFQIFDILNPARPMLVGSLPPLVYSYDVQVADGYAYVTEGLGGLRVVDVRNPAAPVQVTVVPTAGEAYDVRLVNGCAYVAERGLPGYVEVFDLRNPAAPVLLKRYTSSGRIFGVFPRGPLVFAAGHDQGLLVLNPNLSEAPAGTVRVDYNWDDGRPTPTPTPTPTPLPTPDPSQTMTLTLQVNLQGRGVPPSPRWQVPLTVELTAPQGEVLQRYNVTCDAQGQVSIAAVPQGYYDIRVRGRTSLVNLLRNAILGAGVPPIQMGTLLEGDANGDNAVRLADLSLLASAYGTAVGDSGFDARADFNDDGRVNLMDLSLLASNYGRVGPIEVSGH